MPLDKKQDMRYKDAYKKLYTWRLHHISEQTYLLLLSVIVGILSGLAAVLLKTVVHWSGQYVMEIGDAHFASGGGNALILFAPLVGILLTVLFVKYIIKGDIGHGIPTELIKYMFTDWNICFQQHSKVRESTIKVPGIWSQTDPHLDPSSTTV